MLETRVLLSITPSLTGANTATFTGDGADDTLYFQLQSGLLAYSTTGAGGSYTTDLDPAGGTQTLTWSGATVITANLNAGNDAVTIDDALSATMQSTGGKINIAGAAGTLAISSPNALAITGIITNTGAINISALQSIFVLTGASLTSSGGDVNLTTTRSSTSNTASLTQQILVTSATVSGVNVNMTVSSTINATDQDPLNALGSELSLIDVDSTAEVSIAGSSVITATGAVTLSATSSVTTTSTALAKSSGNTAIDAASANSVVDSTAKTHLSGTSQISAGGKLTISATNSVNATTNADGTSAGSTAAGASVAVAVVHSTTQAYIDGGAAVTQANGGVDVLATSTGNVNTSATATAKGASDNNASTKQKLSDNKAQTSDGNIGITATFALNDYTSVNEAYLNSTGAINSSSLVKVSGQANTDSSAVANSSSAAGSSVGVGVAVAINLPKTTNRGAIAGTVTGGVLTAEALMKPVAADSTNTYNASATSGAAATNVGVAGSFALNKVNNTTESLLKTGAAASASGGNVNLTATNTSSSTTVATSKQSGDSNVGVGASVALDIETNPTTAAIQNGAGLSNVGNLTLASTGTHTTSNKAEAGAQSSGAVAVGGAVATTYADNDTLATIGTGGTITTTGAISATAIHGGSTTTLADGTTAGGNVGVGAAIAIGVPDDNAEASTARNLTASGAVTLMAESVDVSSSSAKSSVKGKESDSSKKSDDQANKETTQADAQSGKTNTGRSPSANTSDGQVGVSAALAINVGTAHTLANISAGVTVSSGGLLKLSAKANTDASATADASQTNSSVGVGAAVAINSVDAYDRASISGSATGSGATVEAIMKPVASDTTNTFSAAATSGAGATTVGVAGSFALNSSNNSYEARLLTGASVAGGSGAVNITAANTSATTVTATSKQTGNPSVGVGASAAVDVESNKANAEIQSSAGLTGGSSVTISATGAHDANTKAEVGAAGGVAVAPAVAVAFVTNDTTAQVQGGAAMNPSGSLAISATGTKDNVITTADGTAAGSNVSVGAAIAINVVKSNVESKLARNATVGTTLSVTSSSTTNDTTTAKASVKGASKSDSSADASAQKESTHADPNKGTASQTDLPDAKTSTDSANSNSQSQSGGGSKGVGVAAAISVNVPSSIAKASIANGAVVTAGGAVTIKSEMNADSAAEANATAMNLDSSTQVGAAVSVNVPTVTNTATVAPSTSVTGASIGISAGMISGQNHDFYGRALAGAGAQENGIAGSVSVNVINVTTTASADANSSLNATGGGVSISSTSNMTLQNVAASGGFSLNSVGVGAAVVVNTINSTTDAFIGSGAHSDATGATSVSASGSLVPLDGSLTTDPMSLAGGAGASAGDVGVGGSVIVNVFNLTTQAHIDGSAVVNATAVGGASQSVTVSATDNLNIRDGSGGLGGGYGSAGIGAGIDLSIVTHNTKAFIAGSAQVNAAKDITVSAASTQNITSMAAAAGVGGSAGIAGSATINVLTTNTFANIGNGAVVHAGGNLTVSASDNSTFGLYAGGIAYGGSAGFAASNTTLVHNATVDAWIGSADILSKGSIGLSVTATETQNLTTIAVGGAASGSAGIAASAVVNVINDTTKAHIDGGAKIDATNTAAGVDPSIVVQATDTTSTLSIAGSVAVSASAGIGAGVDVGTITKNTQAWIAAGVGATADQDIKTLANSSEDVSSFSLAGGGSSSVGVMGSAGVYVLNVTTRGFIGDDPDDGVTPVGTTVIRAGGNVIIAANESTEIDMLDGNITVSGSIGIGAAAAVTTVNKKTEAFVGPNADVAGAGNGASATVNNGTFNVQYVAPTSGSNNSVSGNSGEVGLPKTGSSSQDNNKDGVNDYSDQSFTKQRVATPTTTGGFRGVSISAMNKDDIENIAVSGGAAGTVAINIAAAVTVVTNSTNAYIGSGAKVNNDLTGANASQQVMVSSANDFYHLGVGGVASGAGTVAIGPGVDVPVVNNTTTARVDGTAIVKAKGDVVVMASAKEHLLGVAAGIAISGAVSVAGGVSVPSINNTTTAIIGNGATVYAMGNVLVSASDVTEMTQIDGALALGIGAGGVAGSVGIVLITKNTTAEIGNNAVVDGLGTGATLGNIISGTLSGNNFDRESFKGVAVQSYSSEDVFNLAAAGAGGIFFGLSGGVTVTILDSNTNAKIDPGAQVNLQPGADAGQGVNVSAANYAKVIAFAGAAAGGIAGVAGGVNVGSVKNDVSATIGSGAVVHAANQVDVNALSTKDVTDFAFSAAGGFVGLAGSISVWSLGSALQSNYSDGKSNSDSLNDKNGARGDSYMGDQGQQASGQVTSILGGYSTPGGDTTGGKSNSSRVDAISQSAATATNSKAPSSAGIMSAINDASAPPGIQAYITGATIVAGGAVDVQAREGLTIHVLDGSAAAGVAGLGASVDVVTVSSNTRASVGGTLTAGGNINATSSLTELIDTTALAGQGGLVGLGAAVTVVHDNSTQYAYMDNNTQVISAGAINIKASANQTLTTTTGEAAVGLGAVGAAFTKATFDGSTHAYVGDGVSIGQTAGQTVGSLSVNASNTTDLTTHTVALTADSSAPAAISRLFMTTQPSRRMLAAGILP